MKKAGSKGRGRGRGRGVVGGRGRGDSVPAVGTSDSLAPTFRRERSFMRSFLGAGRTPLLREDQIEAVLGCMAATASTSMSSSSSNLLRTEEQPSVSSPPAKLARQLERPVQEPSLILFSESVDLESGGQSARLVEAEEEVCSDAQPFCLSEDEVASGAVKSVSIPQYSSLEDETLVPLSGAYLDVETTHEEQLEEDVDDEALDPSWNAGQETVESSSEEEFATTGQQRKRAQTASRVRGQTWLAGASTLAPSRSRALLNPTRGAPKSCSAWAFFDQVGDDPRLAKCRLCHQTVKRGKNISNLNTTNMLKHVRSKHAVEWQSYTKDVAQPVAQQSTSTAPVVASSSSSNIDAPELSEDIQGTTSGTMVQRHSVSSPQSTQSSHSQSSLQPSVIQVWEKRRQYSANHPRAQALNASISKLLALEML